MWRAVYGSSATERPLGTIPKEKGISSRLPVTISFWYDLSYWKRRKNSFPPFFLPYYALIVCLFVCCRWLRFAALWRAVYGPLQLKDPLELFLKRREFLPCSWFLSHRDMTSAIESDIKTYSFLTTRWLFVCLFVVGGWGIWSEWPSPDRVRGQGQVPAVHAMYRGHPRGRVPTARPRSGLSTYVHSRISSIIHASWADIQIRTGPALVAKWSNPEFKYELLLRGNLLDHYSSLRTFTDHTLTLPMLGLLSSKAQGRKNFW